MIGWRERIVLLLLSVLSGTFSLSTARMSQEQRSQQAQRKHVGIIRGGGLGTETSEGLVGVGIGRSSSPLGGAHLGSSARGTADAGATATDPSERVCWKTERRVFKKTAGPVSSTCLAPAPPHTAQGWTSHWLGVSWLCSAQWFPLFLPCARGVLPPRVFSLRKPVQQS